jgi:L-lactate dehydrogenase complex protein LldG
MLQFVGGTAVFVETVAQAHADLQQRPAWSTAKVRYSVVSGVGDSTPGIDVITDPHQLENVDFAVLRGHLAVAENAAVWVTDETVRHRVLYFLPQHLALVVPARALVHNLHEAYHRLTIGDRPFGAFVSGPSKTADIEQSLVIGAHGARSLVVYLVEDLPEA